MSFEDPKRQFRFDLALRIASIDSAEELLKVQEDIAGEIIRSESSLLEIPDDETETHIRRLRIHADGLAWTVLHPHVIRQLAKNSDVPKSLVEQADSFDVVRQAARDYLREFGAPVLIADITNVLKIGDLIIVVDSEQPIIAEIKSHLPNPEHLMQGRIGRQVSRSIATQEYLRQGSGKEFGKEQYNRVIETPHKSQYNWDVITELVQKAVGEGYASIELSDNETLWACSSDKLSKVILEIAERNNGRTAMFFGTTLALMNMTDATHYPPSVWPILPALRFALVEEDVILVHLVGAAGFESTSSEGMSIKIKAGDDFPVVVKSERREYPLSLNFIYDVVFGFEKMDSAVTGIYKFVHEIENNLDFGEDRAPLIGPEKLRGTKPQINFANTVAEAFTIANTQEFDGGDFVALPPGVVAELFFDLADDHEIFRIDQPGEDGYSIMSLNDLRALVIKGRMR